MKKTMYIELPGCHASSVFEVEVTEEEEALIHRLRDISLHASDGNDCKPYVLITDKETYDAYQPDDEEE